MLESTETETTRQLASIRRELRIVRALLVFVSVSVGVLLFAPVAAVRIAEWSAFVFSFALPGVTVVVVGAGLLVIAAAVASRHTPARPSTPEKSIHPPPA